MTDHLDERLDAWIDGRLAPDERRDADAHLAACERCRDLRDALLATRTALRGAAGEVAVPAGLADRVRAALDREDAGGERPAAATVGPRPVPPAPPRPRPRRRRPLPWAAGLAAAAAAAVVVAFVLVPGDPRTPAGPVRDAFAAYREVASGELPASLRADGPGTIEERWRRGGITFPARVLDLGGMGIGVVGGDASRLGGTSAARSVYRGEAGSFVCWMFPGSLADLPPPAERREHGGLEFLVYRDGDDTLVFWQEGEVVCAFAGRGEPEAVIALAFAKAMAPPVPERET